MSRIHRGVLALPAIGLLSLALGLSAVTRCAAGIFLSTEFYGLEAYVKDGVKDLNKSIRVCVKDGRLVFSDGRCWCDEKDRETPKSDRWYVLGAKIKLSVAGGYLAYDPSGKDRRVFLSREAGKGTDWKIVEQRKDGFGRRVPQAMSGEVKGWWLDVEEHKEKAKDGRMATAYRLILRKDGERTKIYIRGIPAYRATAP